MSDDWTKTLILLGALSPLLLGPFPLRRGNSRRAGEMDVAVRFSGDKQVEFTYWNHRVPSADVIRIGAWLGYRYVRSQALALGRTRWEFVRDPALPERAWQEPWLWGKA